MKNQIIPTRFSLIFELCFLRQVFVKKIKRKEKCERNILFQNLMMSMKFEDS